MTGASTAVPTRRPALPGLWLLLTAVPVAALPHAWEQPPWVIAVLAAALLWRLVIHAGHARLPSRWILVPLVFAGGALTFSHFGTVTGQEAGTALLLVMVALKLLEIRSERDVVVTLFLAYFIVVTTYFFNQSILIAAYSLLSAWLITAALTQVHGGRPLPFRRLARSSAMMLVHALPIMLILFLVFPRIPGPIWGSPGEETVAQTGPSDRLKPGDIAQLLENEATAMRVRFDGSVPPSSLQYWRAQVMTDFDGSGWQADRVITGYQGGQWMDTGNYLRLRQADAHAWTEVWLEDAGWVRVDPTAAIAPERIETGLNGLFSDDADAPAFLRRSGLPWTVEWRLRLSDWQELATFRWESLVLAFDPERQRELFARFGLDATDWRSILIALVVTFGGLGLAAGLIAVARRPGDARDQAQRALDRLSRRFRRHGLEREPHETMTGYANRLSAIRPDLAGPLSDIAEAYTRLRYAELSPAERSECEGQVLRALREVRPGIVLAAKKNAGVSPRRLRPLPGEGRSDQATS